MHANFESLDHRALTIETTMTTSSSYTFLESASDDELVTKSAKELERILRSQYHAGDGKDLLDLVSTGWGLSLLLRLELFIVGTMCYKVVYEPGYKLTTKRRERFVVAFLRSVYEAEVMKQQQEAADTKRRELLERVEVRDAAAVDDTSSSMCVIC